jgi:hypothetical protein
VRDGGLPCGIGGFFNGPRAIRINCIYQAYESISHAQHVSASAVMCVCVCVRKAQNSIPCIDDLACILCATPPTHPARPAPSLHNGTNELPPPGPPSHDLCMKRLNGCPKLQPANPFLQSWPARVQTLALFTCTPSCFAVGSFAALCSQMGKCTGRATTTARHAQVSSAPSYYWFGYSRTASRGARGHRTYYVDDDVHLCITQRHFHTNSMATQSPLAYTPTVTTPFSLQPT